MKHTDIKLIAFDLDGTLCNTIGDIAAALNRALCARGIPPYTVEQVQSMVGHGMANLCKSAMPKGREQEWQQVMEAYYADYSAHLCDSTRPYPGIVETLHALQNRGYLLSVVSNKPHQNTWDMLHGLFPDCDTLFSAIQGQDPRFAVKPNAASLLHVLSTLHITPEQTLYVGDSEVDFAFAQNAGTDFCGVSWGFRGRKLLESLHAPYIIDAPEELLGLCACGNDVCLRQSDVCLRTTMLPYGK